MSYRHDYENIKDCGDTVSTAQALSLSHARQIDSDTGEITALYFDDHFVPVDSIEFADIVETILTSWWDSEGYYHAS